MYICIICYNVDDLSQFEGGLVDRAVSDLPHIASQVFSLNKNQSSEIQRQQKLLAFLQVSLHSRGLVLKGINDHF